MKVYIPHFITVFLILKSITLFSQKPQDTVAIKQQPGVDTGLVLIEKIAQLPTDLLTSQYGKLENRLTKGLLKSLEKIQQKELQLKKKMAFSDSLKAQQLFNSSNAKINQLKNKLLF